MRKPNPLLYDIKQSIRDAGGAAQMRFHIIMENREYFSAEEAASARRRVIQTASYHRWYQKVRNENDFWTEADAEFVLKHYGTMKTSLLAAIVNRTGIAVRDYFNRNATTDQKIWVMTKGRYAGRIKNFRK